MECTFCGAKEADKANTHYLTDAIIRPCLNQDGRTEREMGFYFELPGAEPNMKFRFQRGTSISKLEAALGRKPSEAEIELAKQIPYSVDNVFCSTCEKIFTKIESEFIDKILPKFRNADLSSISSLEFGEVILIRKFLYLQIWRSHVCDKDFEIAPEIAEQIRRFILDPDSYEQAEICTFPLVLTHLETRGGGAEYTNNIVGFTNDTNPYIIFLNDFVIQLFASIEDVNYDEYYGLNQSEHFHDFVNYKEASFRIKVLSDEQRKAFLARIIEDESAKEMIKSYVYNFYRNWVEVFGALPKPEMIRNYLHYITNGDFEVLKYSKEDLAERTKEFFNTILSRDH